MGQFSNKITNDLIWKSVNQDLKSDLQTIFNWNEIQTSMITDHHHTLILMKSLYIFNKWMVNKNGCWWVYTIYMSNWLPLYSSIIFPFDLNMSNQYSHYLLFCIPHTCVSLSIDTFLNSAMLNGEWRRVCHWTWR